MGVIKELMAQTQANKQMFDPANPRHIKTYKSFIRNNKWSKPCPFVLEWPYNSIPDMIKNKLIQKYIDSMLAIATNNKPIERD